MNKNTELLQRPSLSIFSNHEVKLKMSIQNVHMHVQVENMDKAANNTILTKVGSIDFWEKHR